MSNSRYQISIFLEIKFAEQKGVKYIRRNVYFVIIVFDCLTSQISQEKNAVIRVPKDTRLISQT